MLMLCVWAGCTLTRSAAMAAYEQQGRALLAGARQWIFQGFIMRE